MTLLLWIIFGAFNGILLQSLRKVGEKESDMTYAVVGAAGALAAVVFAFIFLSTTYLEISPIMLGVIFAEIGAAGLYLLVKRRQIIIS